MNANYRNFALWVIIFLLVLALVTLFQSPGQKAPSSEITFSQLLTDADAGNIRDVTIAGPEISGHMKDGRSFQTYAPSDPSLVQTLYKKDVTITAKPPSDGNNWLLTIVSSVLPVLLFLGLWIYMTRQMQGGAGKAMGFGKSKAKLLTEAQGRVTFEDVAGVDEAKEDLQEIVEFLRDPQKFQKLGGRIPRGVLLVGPPGTGKTLTARAVAGEANVPFFTISGSDFVEMFVGVGASRVRDMFEQAKKNAPCIIFIDEIDAVGRHRGAGLGGGNDEREQTLNQLLVEMDGFEQNEGIIIIAATNRPDVLDPALLRPGRFDRQIVISNPDFIGREKILQGPCAQGPARARRRPQGRRARNAGLLGRGPDESRQRGGAARRAAGKARRHAAGIRGFARQDHDGRRAAHPHHDRRGKAARPPITRRAMRSSRSRCRRRPRSTRRRSSRAAARSAWCSRCPSATRSRRATSS